MIRPLRTVHGIVFTTLALVLPAVVAVALASRHLESSSAQYVAAPASAVRSSRGVFAVTTDGRSLIVTGTGDGDYPDALLYLSNSDEITDRSVLLGQFFGGTANRFQLPMSGAGNRVVLFSAATRSMIDSALLGGQK